MEIRIHNEFPYLWNTWLHHH